MEYQYITNNNLIDTQDYMYSRYEGKKFLQSYVKSRKEFLTSNELLHIDQAIERLFEVNQIQSNTFESLKKMYMCISECDVKYPLTEIDLYQKRFEVKKRLYDLYPNNQAMSNTEDCFDNMNLYLILSAILLKTYCNTKSMTYFSTFIKINDTLLSCYTELNELQKCIVQSLVQAELDSVQKLCIQNGIILEEI